MPFYKLWLSFDKKAEFDLRLTTTLRLGSGLGRFYFEIGNIFNSNFFKFARKVMNCFCVIC